jgi:hypothetical protein
MPLLPPSKNLWSLPAIAFFLILCMGIQACTNNNDCDKTFVKKSTTPTGEAYQSDTLQISLPAPSEDSLSCFAIRNMNGEIELTFLSASPQRHFSNEDGDSVMVILYGSVPKDTLKPSRTFSNKDRGTKFYGTTSFRIEDALTADIVAQKSNNQINFVLGTYKFVLSDEMYCTFKQMLKAK